MSPPARNQRTPDTADLGLDFDATQEIDTALDERLRNTEATLSQVGFDDFEIDVERLRRAMTHRP